MTWADPSTRATGDVVTSAIWNVQVTNSRNITYNKIQYGMTYLLANTAVGAGAIIPFDTSLNTYDGYWDAGTPGRLTAVITGMHMFSLFASLSGASVLTVQKNGADLVVLGSFTNYYQAHLIYLEATDYVTVKLTTARTVVAYSEINLKLMTGGWTDYDYWGVV